ncbi:phage tail sheath subtilisin-like domain-containing protein [Teredinibacter turnerae]|uniref:phage tail sheath subtilisin-like domain-containing protein n=1 Tax=Teredinibacter turnerae TaxID=2426 RepID=UPI0030D53BC3
MAESAFSEQIIPGTYVRVLAEGLISVGGISAGNIGIVGTADTGVGETHKLGDWESAQNAVGAYDAYAEGAGTLNLTRSLSLLFKNGARTVYARALAAGSDQAAFTTAFNELIKEDVNILVAPELTTDQAKAVLGPLVDSSENNGKDVIAVIGSDVSSSSDIAAQVAANKRIIMTAPGVVMYDSAAGANVDLNGRYTAAPLAGLISSLAVQTSPTNKVLSGVVKLVNRFSYVEMKDLLNGGVCALEDRSGIRVVRGLTTQAVDNGPFSQITTRRITDKAKAGVRKACNPFIGRLNNQRVRAAMQGAIDGFLTTMVQDEALTEYTLEVTATRQDEIAGRAIVNVALKPTFSIDFIRVTLSLS